MRSQLTWSLFAVVLVLWGVPGNAQQKGGVALPTATDIVQRAIDNAGGHEKLQAIRSAEFMNQLIVADKDTLSIAVKRKGYNKYYVSVLSLGYANETTVFNNGHAVKIKNDTAIEITDHYKLEELALQCYSSTDYGYKKLGYKLTRAEDLRVNEFDCYTVIAESPLGKKTANYYDKKTGNCIMILYSTGGKTVFPAFLPYKGLQYPRTELLLDANGTISRSDLTEINIDEDPDDHWFDLHAAGNCAPPPIFKTGRFNYLNHKDSTFFVRDGEKQVETGKGSSREFRIKWTSDSDYLLFRLKDPTSPPTNDNLEYLKVRITAWNGNRIYCHYISSSNQSGTSSFERIQ
jgi:hypothetical protein